MAWAGSALPGGPRGPAAEDVETLHSLIGQHLRHTRSPRAEKILEKWQSMLPKFVKIMPVDYRRALADLAAEGPKVSREAGAREPSRGGAARGERHRVSQCRQRD